MTELDFISKFGPTIGLLLYIFIQHGIPFLKDKFWPAIREDKKELLFLRREADAKLMDLEERKVIAEEQVAKNLILLTEKTSWLEKEIRRHDEHTMNVMAQMTTTLVSLNTVLLDRVTRTEAELVKQNLMKGEKDDVVK